MTSITTIADAIRDLQQDDLLATREELAAQRPGAVAILWTTGDEKLTVTDVHGEPITAAQALTELDSTIDA